MINWIVNQPTLDPPQVGTTVQLIILVPLEGQLQNGLTDFELVEVGVGLGCIADTPHHNVNHYTDYLTATESSHIRHRAHRYSSCSG